MFSILVGSGIGHMCVTQSDMFRHK